VAGSLAARASDIDVCSLHAQLDQLRVALAEGRRNLL